MFAHPCDAEAFATHSPNSRRRAHTCSIDIGSESTAAPGGGGGSDGGSLPSPSASAPPSPALGPAPDLALIAQLPSVGSVLHAQGCCRPCGWFWKPQGCKNGRECGHCHLCPSGEIQARKKEKIAAAKCRFSAPTSPNTAAAVSLDAYSSSPSQPAEPSPPSNVRGVALPSILEPPPSRSPQLLQLQHLVPHSAPPVPPSEPPRLALERPLPPAPPSEPPCLTLPEEAGVVPPPPPLSPAFRSLTNGVASSSPYPPADHLLPPQGGRVSLELSEQILPSKGSAQHGDGLCTACAWFWKPQGCANGKDCSYCHLCPLGEIRRRRKMKNAVLRAKDAAKNEDAAQSNSAPLVERSLLEIFPLLL